MPRLSVLVTAYNAREWIKEALDSVKGQAFRDWECLIGDDCSTDDTAEIVSGLAGDDKRFKLSVELVNKGGGENIAGLMKRATSDICVELGADDYFYSPDALSKIVAEYDAFPLCEITSGSFVFIPDSGIVAYKPDKFWWKRWSFAKPLTWKAELGVRTLCEFRDLQIDPETGLMPRYGWDVAIYYPMMYRAKRHRWIPDVSYAYRTHDRNDQRDHRKDQLVTERRMAMYFDKILSRRMPWNPPEEPDTPHFTPELPVLKRTGL